MLELKYERPTTIKEAVGLMVQDGVRLLAGGTDLIPQLREGRRSARVVIDLKHIPEMTAIARLPDGAWSLGAATTISALGAHPEFAGEHGALLDAGRLIGSLQIQNRASLGGNLCNAAPSADAVPLLIALEAMVEIVSAGNRRRISTEEIASAPGRITLAPGELVTAIHIPAQASRSAARYLRFTPRREMDIAVAGSGVAIALDPRGNIETARITLASVAPTPLRAAQAESSLVGQQPSQAAFTAAAAMAANEARPISDTRGAAEYRRELVAVLTRRALADCARQLGVELV